MEIVDRAETERIISWLKTRHELIVEMIKMTQEELNLPEEEMRVMPLEELGQRAWSNVKRRRRQKRDEDTS